MFTEELKKLGVRGGVLTPAGRKLDLKEVRKGGLCVLDGPPLYTTHAARAAVSGFGFAFNFGSGRQPLQPGPTPKDLSSSNLTPGKKVAGGRSGDTVPGLVDDSSSDSGDDAHIANGKALVKEILREKFPDAKLVEAGKGCEICQCQGDHKEEVETGTRPKRRVMIPCSRREMETHFKDSKDEEEKMQRGERSTAWDEYTAQKKQEEEDKVRTERLL